jgi:hypothetical protein
MKKTRGRKSRVRVPLTNPVFTAICTLLKIPRNFQKNTLYISELPLLRKFYQCINFVAFGLLYSLFYDSPNNLPLWDFSYPTRPIKAFQIFVRLIPLNETLVTIPNTVTSSNHNTRCCNAVIKIVICAVNYRLINIF